MVILDVSDITRPRQAAQLRWDGGSTHTCLPLPGRSSWSPPTSRSPTGRTRRGGPSGSSTSPGQPAGAGALPAARDRFDQLPLRFGAHNLHENQPGAYRSERLVFATYFSAGVRVYDLADPAHPREVAHWVPDPPPGQPVAQINDLFVDDGGLIWVTDRIGGGLYVLQPEPASGRADGGCPELTGLGAGAAAVAGASRPARAGPAAG